MRLLKPCTKWPTASKAKQIMAPLAALRFLNQKELSIGGVPYAISTPGAVLPALDLGRFGEFCFHLAGTKPEALDNVNAYLARLRGNVTLSAEGGALVPGSGLTGTLDTSGALVMAYESESIRGYLSKVQGGGFSAYGAVGLYQEESPARGLRKVLAYHSPKGYAILPYTRGVVSRAVTPTSPAPTGILFAFRTTKEIKHLEGLLVEATGLGANAGDWYRACLWAQEGQPPATQQILALLAGGIIAGAPRHNLIQRILVR